MEKGKFLPGKGKKLQKEKNCNQVMLSVRVVLKKVETATVKVQETVVRRSGGDKDKSRSNQWKVM